MFDSDDDTRRSNPNPKSNPKSKPDRAAGAAAMGGRDEEEEETPHRLLVAQMIEKKITPIFKGHFLAIIGHWALPDFMKMRERPRSLVPVGMVEFGSDSAVVKNERDSSNVDMLCILCRDPALRGLSYKQSVEAQFGHIEDGIQLLQVEVAPLKKGFRMCVSDKPDEMCTLKGAVSLSVSRAGDGEMLRPRYLFPGIIVKFVYQGKPLITFSIEINTGIDTNRLQAAIAPCPVHRVVFSKVNIYGMAILLYHGMLDNVVKLRWDFDDMMTKCHKHLEAVRLGGVGGVGVNPRHLIEAGLQPPSANFIVELIGICNDIFRDCIILDYRYTGKNMLEYLLKLFNPIIRVKEHLPIHPTGNSVIFGSYNKFESEQVGNRVLGVAYGVVGGRRVSVREAINATIGSIGRAIKPLGGVIVKSGGEVAVYRGLDAEGHDASFSTNDIDTKVWVTIPANRDQIYEIITDMLFALVKYVAHYKFMDNFIRAHNVQFPEGIDTYAFGKGINCKVSPLDEVSPGMLSACARIIHINPHNNKRTSAVRKKITLLSMDTTAVTNYCIGDYNDATQQFTVNASCSGYLVASPLDIAFDNKPFKVAYVAEIPRQAQHGWAAASAAQQQWGTASSRDVASAAQQLPLPKSEPVKATILSNAFMVEDIERLLHNADRRAIPGKTAKDELRQLFFKSDPPFRHDSVRGGVSAVEMLTSGYDGVVGLDALYGVQVPDWCIPMEPFFASQRELFLAAIHDEDGRHKTPKNPKDPEKEENHRDYAEGGGNAVLNKINTRTRRRVKKYKQKSNKLTRNKKRSYKSSSR
jgi:hypothetical protein